MLRFEHGAPAFALGSQEIRARLKAEVNTALASDLREKFTSQGLQLTPGSTEDFVKFQRDDMTRAQKIITEGNIRVE